MYKIISFLPEIYFFFSITIVFLYCIVYYLSSVLKHPNLYLNTIYLSVICLIYTFFLFLNNSFNYLDFSIIYKNEGNIILSELFILICLFILVVSISYNKFWKIHYFEYSIFILISLGCFFIFLNLMNILFIYVLLELQSILISILICLKKSNRYSIEASIKYFILGSFSSLIWLYGFSIIYGSTGLLSLHDMNLFFEYFEQLNNLLVITSIKISSVFILVGLLFKIYSAPFHFWLPDIYEGAPTSVLIYISSVQLFFMVFFFLKIYYYLLFDLIKLKQFIIYIIAIFTLLFGSVGTLVQRRIKKLISFSAITMNGFFLFSIVNNNSFLVETSLMYLIIYIFNILLLFSLLLNIFVSGKNNIVYLSDLFKMYSKNKSISTLFTILFFSVSGIPPFIGFISKLFWLKSIVMEYNVFIFLLLLVFLIVSFYYFRLIKNLYSHFNQKDGTVFYLNTLSYESCVLIMLIQSLLTLFIFNSSLITNFIKLLLFDFILT